MLIAGEVHTGLLRGPDPVTSDQARRLVDLVVGEQVLVSERPIAYVRSPEMPIGVDCGLGAAGPARQVRGVGTALQRVAITGGHVVQGSAYAAFVRGDGGVRRPWSHYLTRPGVIETLGRTRWEETAAALAAPERPGSALDLGAMAGRAADRVQRSVAAGGTVRLRSPRTRLRWVASVEEPDAGVSRVGFSVGAGDLRVLRLTVRGVPAAELAAVCEDVAMHDWLLSALLEIIGKSAIGAMPRQQALERLLPAIDYLLHLWMPGARGDELTADVWDVLERRPGFSRQWDTLVHRIRDQLSVGAVAALAAVGNR
ncbi:SCO2521 family protein [Actinoplanes sp. NPDC026623]|uniref:SCO2521 family protein n=1 Tax=Actinoplanes sp. NPDC026623 TaxID=3155610 RepID=UPI0033C1A91D